MYSNDTFILVPLFTAARILSIGCHKFMELEAQGKIGPKPFKFENRLLYAVDELKQWAWYGCPSRKNWQKIKKRLSEKALHND